MDNWFQWFAVTALLFLVILFLGGGPPKPQPEYVHA